jgi:hypothetical protein
MRAFNVSIPVLAMAKRILRLGVVSVIVLPAACSSSGGVQANGNPPGCPAELPMQSTACFLRNDTSCSYATGSGDSCGGGGASAICENGSWAVLESGAPVMQGCPEFAPEDGSSCTASCGAAVSCTFDCAHCNGNNCTATCNGSTWSVAVFASPCAGAEAGVPDAGACLPLQSYCASAGEGGVGCATTENQAVALACASQGPPELQSCGGYTSLTLPSVDSATTYVFNSSGQLVGVVESAVPQGGTCYGVTSAACSSPSANPCPSDAGPG